jgi:hypothetical protein
MWAVGQCTYGPNVFPTLQLLCDNLSAQVPVESLFEQPWLPAGGRTALVGCQQQEHSTLVGHGISLQLLAPQLLPLTTTTAFCDAPPSAASYSTGDLSTGPCRVGCGRFFFTSSLSLAAATAAAAHHLEPALIIYSGAGRTLSLISRGLNT